MKTQTKIAFLILLITATSCASRKKTVIPTPASSYEWLTSNVDIDIEGNGLEFNDLSGQLRIRKDSIIWISVTAPLGVEIGRVKISADSAWIINRMEKTYLAEPLDNLAKRFGMPVSLPWIQSLLLDNNEGVPPVDNQMVLLKNQAFGMYSAKMRYNKVQLEEETTFPLKITNKMERIRLPKKK